MQTVKLTVKDSGLLALSCAITGACSLQRVGSRINLYILELTETNPEEM